jgi:cytoskeletal protein RodZ
MDDSRGVEGMESIGEHLKRNRELRARTLAEVARETRIPIAALELLENDRFDELPGDVFVRGFLRAYARAVSISIDDTIARYTLSRRSTSVVRRLTPPPRGDTPLRNRLSVAIALVALLILFTIALSVLLKPRAQRIPSELANTERLAAQTMG